MKKLIALVLIQNFVVGQIKVPPEDGLDLFNNMMRYLFSKCRSEFGTIGFWGIERIFLADDEVDFVLVKDNQVFKRPPTRRIKFLVAVIDLKHYRMPKIKLFDVKPTLEIESMFVFDKGNYSEKKEQKIFRWYQNLFKNSKVYYCFMRNEKLVIISLNALTDIAPPFWTRKRFIEFNNIRPRGRILEITYDKATKFNDANFGLCKDIFFDRTEKLNGYKIKTAAMLKNYFKSKIKILITNANDTSEVTSILPEKEGLFSKVLTDYLNVTIEMTLYKRINRSSKTSNLIRDHAIELSLAPSTWTDDEKYNLWSQIYLTYPFNFFYEQIVTHNRGLATPLEKMFEFYGWLIIITTLVILLIVFLVIYLSNSENNSRISFAVFECLRILISNSMYTRMDTTKMRIFFSVIFLYFLIIQATFSGHLAAFLTKPVYRKNVETLEDLQDSRYTRIYANQRSRDYIEGTVIDKKTKFGGNCKKHINDISVACIDRQQILSELIRRYNLHTPKNFVKFSYSVLTMSHHSALRHRINNMLLRLTQSGIMDLWNENIEGVNNKMKIIEFSSKNYHRPIKLEDIMFAFVLLGIGLFSSIVCFIAEYLLKTCTNNKTKISTSLSKVKRFTIFIVRFFVLRFCRLF